MLTEHVTSFWGWGMERWAGLDMLGGRGLWFKGNVSAVRGATTVEE